MTEHLISMFIDDELNLDEKTTFVESVHDDAGYKNETVDLLNQEKRLRQDPVDRVPVVVLPSAQRKVRFQWLRPALAGFSCLAIAIVVWMAWPSNDQMVQLQPVKSHRFVIYQPDISSVQITGSFTDWQPITMDRIGNSGYWETEMELYGGEHRFVYILDGQRRIADPTVQIREKDDFGGENSILSVTL